MDSFTLFIQVDEFDYVEIPDDVWEEFFADVGESA